VGHEAALATRSLILVDDTLCGGGIDALDRKSSLLRDVGAPFLRGREGTLRASLEFGADRLVAETSLLILSVALDLALDVGHEVLCR